MEESYVLRLPPELAAEAQRLMHTNPQQELPIEVRFVRSDGATARPGTRAIVKIGEAKYPAKLLQLPTVVETHKSVDGVNYYKSGAIGQVLVVGNQLISQHDPESSGISAHGLTEVTKNVDARLWNRQSTVDREAAEALGEEFAALGGGANGAMPEKGPNAVDGDDGDKGPHASDDIFA